MKEELERISVPVADQNDSAEQPKPKKQRTAAAKAIDAQRARDRRERLRLKKQQEENRKGIRSALENFDGPDEETKAGAKCLLEARGVSPGHLLDTVFELGLAAAQQLKLPTNAFFWSNGIVATLRSIEAKKACPLEPVENSEIPGELVLRTDLFALYDYSIAWRPDRMTFQEFIDTRRMCKTDLIKFGRDILGKDIHERPHQTWADLLPKFNPDTLRPGYGQEDMKRALGAVSECKKRLLIASRNSYKSSVAGVWLLQAVLFCPDLRALYVSETKPLSRAMIRGFRSYWERKPGTPTKFNQLFPEMMIAAESGSELTFQSPMAHLDLIQATAESTSMDSTVAGNRADAIILDDPISNVTVGNETQRNASIEKFDLLLKLLEVGSLGSIVLGTPWHQEDLYAILLQRNEEDEDKPLMFRIDPAFTVKDELKKQATTDEGLLSLTEDQVTLLFPTRLTWKFLKSEMNANKKSLRVFRMQNLCEFLPEHDDTLRVTFTEDDLKARTKPLSFFEPMAVIDTVLSVDCAWSVSAMADFSCLCLTKIIKRENKNTAVVTWANLGRWKMSELGVQIAEAIHTYSPTKIVIEKNGPWQSLAVEIQKAAMMRSYILPYIYWKATNLGGTTMKTKTMRIKAIEPMIADSTLFFVQGIPCLEQGLEQMVSFDGVNKSSRKKNDFPDSLALGIETFFPRDEASQEKSAERDAAEEEARNAAGRQQMYSRIFGTDSVAQRPTTTVSEPINRGEFNIPGLRRPALTPSPSTQIGFGSLRKTTAA